MRRLPLRLTLLIAFMTPALPAAEQPNIVMIISDDQAWGDYSFMGHPHIRTPNIDQLAEDGLRLTQFLVEPGCTPSRAALQTGQYSIRNGMSLVIAPGAGGGLQDDDITLGELFGFVLRNRSPAA